MHFAESLLPSPVGGFLRAAVWEDNGWTDGEFGAHQCLIGRIGYAKEIPVGPNQTVGLEIVTGAGTLWGKAPPYRRFYGGNAPTQFLYDSVSGPGMIRSPAGPLIRSFGQAEATPDGNSLLAGDSFWHANLNLTIPIKALSKPLIPDDPEIRKMLGSGIFTSGRSFLITALKNQGMSREAAVAEADRTFNDIRPAAEFIIDEANLYAVKPLLMFDAAELSGAGRDSTWFAAGGGVQLTIVTAKVELGYMQTLSGPVFRERGNFFFRLVFENLF